MISHNCSRMGDWVQKVTGLRNTNWGLQNCHRDVDYDIGKRVNNFVMTAYRARWVLEIMGGQGGAL